MVFKLQPITIGGPVRLALYGESFSGKSHSAVTIARALVPDGLIALIDTEGKSGAFAAWPNVQAGRLTDYSPQALLTAIRQVEQSSAAILIIDGLSDVWDKPGGLISIADGERNSHRGWGIASQQEKKIHAAIQNSPLHIIATMRGRTDGDGENIEFIQRKDISFVFDTMGWMDEKHTLHITKAYAPGLLGEKFPCPGENVANLLRGYYMTPGAARWVHNEDQKGAFYKLANDDYEFSRTNALDALKREQAVNRPGDPVVVVIEDYTGDRGAARQALSDYDDYLTVEAQNSKPAQPALVGIAK